MPQVRKRAVEHRIHAAALRRFAEDGFAATSMAAIAETAGMAPANLYRYHPGGKKDLFDTVVPSELADRFDRLITERVRALPLGDADPGTPEPHGEELLAFWIRHRLEVVILLARAADTPYRDYPARFESLLMDLGLERLRRDGTEPTTADRQLLAILFSNTRVAVAEILLRFDTEPAIRRAIEGFWRYQLPGLTGLREWFTGDSGA